MEPQYLKLSKKHHFDYTYLMDYLKKYRNPKNKVSQMLKAGEILRIKRGLFTLAPNYGGTTNILELANAIYGPSYISLEYALSFYLLIPERVYEITSVVNKRTSIFKTELGAFSYKHIKNRAFYSGVCRNHDANGQYLIASKEKALYDRILTEPSIRSISDLRILLIENLRIDEDNLKELDIKNISSIRDMSENRRGELLFKYIFKLKNQ